MEGCSESEGSGGGDSSGGSEGNGAFKRDFSTISPGVGRLVVGALGHSANLVSELSSVGHDGDESLVSGGPGGGSFIFRSIEAVPGGSRAVTGGNDFSGEGSSVLDGTLNLCGSGTSGELGSSFREDLDAGSGGSSNNDASSVACVVSTGLHHEGELVAIVLVENGLDGLSSGGGLVALEVGGVAGEREVEDVGDESDGLISGGGSPGDGSGGHL